MDSTCQAGTVQGHGGWVMLCDAFSWQSLGSSVVGRPPSMQYGHRVAW